MLTSLLIYVSAVLRRIRKQPFRFKTAENIFFLPRIRKLWKLNPGAKLVYSAEYSQATQFSAIIAFHSWNSVQIKELYVWFLILLKSSSTYNISTLFYCKLYFQLLAFLCQHRRVNYYFVFVNRVVTIYIICGYHSYSICFRSWCSVRPENPHDILEKRIAKSGTFNLLK